MALFDFLKRKSAKSRQGRHLGGPAPIPQKAGLGGKEKPDIEKTVPTKKRTAVFSYDVVKEPHISEKATMLSEKNQYIFKIYSNTNKIEIKKAIEGIYGVDVLSANIIKIPKKKRRLGKVQGFKAGSVKAIVKIKEGQKIEIL